MNLPRHPVTGFASGTALLRFARHLRCGLDPNDPLERAWLDAGRVYLRLALKLKKHELRESRRQTINSYRWKGA
jgi:hypothetical protein